MMNNSVKVTTEIRTATIRADNLVKNTMAIWTATAAFQNIKVPVPEISKRGPASKLEQQVAQIRQLSRTKQKFVSEMLDSVLHQANG